MTISRVNFISIMICFVVIFTMFSTLSPLYASSDKHVFYYYEPPTQSLNTRKTSQQKTNHPSQTIYNSASDDEDGYEVYIVKSSPHQKRNVKRKPLSFSQMATAIKKKQQIKKVSRQS